MGTDGDGRRMFENKIYVTRREFQEDSAKGALLPGQMTSEAETTEQATVDEM